MDINKKYLVNFIWDRGLICKTSKFLTGLDLSTDCFQLRNHIEVIFLVDFFILWGENNENDISFCLGKSSPNDYIAW